MKLPEIRNGFKGPTRVIVEASGLAVPPKQARDVFQVSSEIIFIRDDGWMLGAPRESESIAFNMWEGSWTHFLRRPHTQWIPIERYIK